MDGEGWEEGGRVEGVIGGEKREKPEREGEKGRARAQSGPSGSQRRPCELEAERSQAEPGGWGSAEWLQGMHGALCVRVCPWVCVCVCVLCVWTPPHSPGVPCCGREVPQTL